MLEEQITTKDLEGQKHQNANSKKESVVDRVKIWVADNLRTYQEKRLASQLQREEINNPYAVEVIKYFETIVVDYGQVYDEATSLFKYSSEHAKSIKNLTEGLNHPVSFYKNLFSIYRPPSVQNLKDFSELIVHLKEYPNLEVRVETIAKLGKFTQVALTHPTSVLEEKSLIESLISLSEIDFERIFSTANCTMLSELIEEILSSSYLQQTIQTNSIIKINELPELLTLVTNEAKYSLLRYWLAGKPLTKERFDRFASLTSRYSFLEILFKHGFTFFLSTQNRREWNLFKEYSHSAIRLLEERKDYLEKISQDEELLEKVSFLTNNGAKFSPFEEQKIDILNLMNIESVKSIIFIIEHLREICTSSKPSLPDFFTIVGLFPSPESIQQVSLQEVQELFDKTEEMPKLHKFSQGEIFGELKSGNDFMNRLRVVASDRAQKYLLNHNLLSSLGIQTSSQLGDSFYYSQILKESESFLWLVEQNIDDISDRLQTFQNFPQTQNPQLQVTYRGLKILMELTPLERVLVRQIIIDERNFTVTNEHLEKYAFVAQLPVEKKEQLFHNLKLRGLSLSMGGISLDRIKMYISDEGQDIFQYADYFDSLQLPDEFFYSKGMPSRAGENRNLYSGFLQASNFLILEEFLLWLRQSENFKKLRQILENIQDPILQKNLIHTLSYLTPYFRGEQEIDIMELVDETGIAKEKLLDLIIYKLKASGENMSHLAKKMKLLLTDEAINNIADKDIAIFYKFLKDYALDLHFVLIRKVLFLQDKFVYGSYPFTQQEEVNIQFFIDLVGTDEILDGGAIKLLVEQENFPPVPQNEQKFWDIWQTIDDASIKNLLLQNKQRIDQLFDTENRPTLLFLQLLLEEDAQLFVEKIGKEQWVQMLGETGEQFLDIIGTLPNDERRNAFLHNSYDRTSSFLQYFLAARSEFSISPLEVSILSAFISEFGLSRDAEIHHYFRHLYIRDNLETLKKSYFSDLKDYEFPSELETLGLSSVEDLIDQLRQVKKIAFTDQELRYDQLVGFSKFQRQMLFLLCKYPSHRFLTGRIGSEQIFQDFLQDDELGLISEVSKEFHSMLLIASEVTLELDDESIEDTYKKVSDEILYSISHLEEIQDLRDSLLSLILSKLQVIQSAIERSGGNKYLLEQQEQLTSFIKDLENDGEQVVAIAIKKRIDKIIAEIEEERHKTIETEVDMESKEKRLGYLSASLAEAKHTQEEFKKSNTEDALMIIMLEAVNELPLGKKDLPGLYKIMRDFIIRRVLRQWQPSTIENFRQLIGKGLQVGSLKEVEAFIREHIFSHAVNFNQEEDSAAYWSKATHQFLCQFRQDFKQIMEFYDPYRLELAEAVEKIRVIQAGGDRQIVAMPNRGLIGELSGYLADVCYTKEYPLLKARPNLTPYIFIAEDVETGEKDFFGSVLIFEVKDNEGNNCFLIRAFDVPSEDQVNIEEFIEQFLNNLEEIGRAKGIQRILIPGVDGAISNYPLTIRHMHNYLQYQQKVTLEEKFDFNGNSYDLTNRSYIARELGDLQGRRKFHNRKIS